ncbi:MAG: outer membrane beta-barrel protein, partial [Bacteroidetes bacterium]|nr:outer membrane beta-barrel protein [Bacteroidota bacterium]
MKKKYNLSIFEKHFLNFGCYITFLIFLTFVFTTSLVAQENPKLESRLVFSKQAGAQSYLKIEGAQVFSIFKFSTKIDNPNLTSEDTPTYAHTSVSAFGIGYERVKSNGLLILGGLGMRKAGSSLIYKKIDYLWKMQYIDVKAGIGYQVNKWPIKPYAAVLPYFAYLYNAKQSIGTNSYDIKASGSFKNSDFGMFMALGFKAGISPYISIYSEYNYILGLQNIETGNEQYLYNRGFSFKLGIALTLSSYTTHKEDVIQTPTDFLAPESAYLVDKPPVKNTPPVLEKKAEVPVIETMTEP